MGREGFVVGMNGVRHNVAGLVRFPTKVALLDLLSVLRAAKRLMDSSDDGDYFDSTILLNEALSRFLFEDEIDAER
jgi:hypothetical protein